MPEKNRYDPYNDQTITSSSRQIDSLQTIRGNSQQDTIAGGLAQIFNDDSGYAHNLWNPARANVKRTRAKALGLTNENFDAGDSFLISSRPEEEGGLFMASYIIENNPLSDNRSANLVLKAYQIPRPNFSSPGLVAIKFLLPDPSVGQHYDAQNIKQRLLAEAQTQAKLIRHTVNIISILEVAPPMPFEIFSKHQETLVAFTTPFFPRGTLEKTIKNRPRQDSGLGIEKAIIVANSIADALDCAHSQEDGVVIHGDIKPSNILRGEDGDFYLTDFGICNRVETLIDRKGMIVGSPRYTSPETIESGVKTPHSDLYAFGLVIYETLTGQPAIKGDNLAEVIDEVARVNGLTVAHKKKLKELNLEPAIDPLDRMLQKDPADRYPTAAAFAIDIASAIDSITP